MRELYLKLLRDYLAAKAMAALMPIPIDGLVLPRNKIKAELAYKMADFMLEVRDAENS